MSRRPTRSSPTAPGAHPVMAARVRGGGLPDPHAWRRAAGEPPDRTHLLAPLRVGEPDMAWFDAERASQERPRGRTAVLALRPGARRRGGQGGVAHLRRPQPPRQQRVHAAFPAMRCNATRPRSKTPSPGRRPASESPRPTRPRGVLQRSLACAARRPWLRAWPAGPAPPPVPRRHPGLHRLP